jgi:hypothetical protein
MRLNAKDAVFLDASFAMYADQPSRFLPFYKVKTGKRTCYVRLDGKVFSRLTKRK